MKDIIKLYNEIKSMEGVDFTLIELYIKNMLKDSKCATIEELNQKIVEKQEEVAKVTEEINTTNKMISEIKAEINQLYLKKEDERKHVRKKGTLLMVTNIIVIGIAAVIFVTFLNLPALFLAIALLLADTKISFTLFNNLSSNYYKMQKEMDELHLQETMLNNDYRECLLDLMYINNNLRPLDSIKENIIDFFESYISARNSSQVLTQETNIEETREISEETEKAKSLHV